MLGAPGDLEQKPSDKFSSHHHWDQISEMQQTALCRVLSNMLNICMRAVFKPYKASADWRPQLWVDSAHINQVVQAVCNQVSTYTQLCLSDTANPDFISK